MAKKKKQTKKEKQLRRKLEALKANQSVYIDDTQQKDKLKHKSKSVEKKAKEDLSAQNIDKILADDSIIITDDKHIRSDLIRTTIFTIVVSIVIIALKYLNPLA